METIRDFQAGIDRCDRCGSQAYHVAESPMTGKELLFCAHHMSIHHNRLVECRWAITTDVTGLERIGKHASVAS